MSMQIVWTAPNRPDSKIDHQPFHGRYQDILRAIGAWLDARSYRLTRLSESDGCFVIEVETGVAGDDLSREILRLDMDAINRLTSAARNDRDRFLQAG
jgi:hypothetical protein